MKHDKKTRLISLMSFVGWEGVDNWKDLRTELQDNNLLPFKRWLINNVKCIPGRARIETEAYYLQHADLDISSGRAMYLQQGRAALYAAYMKDQECDRHNNP